MRTRETAEEINKTVSDNEIRYQKDKINYENNLFAAWKYSEQNTNLLQIEILQQEKKTNLRIILKSWHRSLNLQRKILKEKEEKKVLQQTYFHKERKFLK